MVYPESVLTVGAGGAAIPRGRMARRQASVAKQLVPVCAFPVGGLVDATLLQRGHQQFDHVLEASDRAFAIIASALN